MANIRVASRYVRSLLGLAVEQNVLDEVHTDMKLIADTCERNRDLVLMLKSPVIRHDKKKAILNAVFGGKVHPLTLAILDILTTKNRESLLPSIAKEFHHAYNIFNSIGQASITTTVPLDGKLRTEIEQIVKKLSNVKELELEEIIDKDLIGGFILNVGDRQIDASIKSKLKALKVKFSENPYLKDF